jgi:hypothetical protein
VRAAPETVIERNAAKNAGAQSLARAGARVRVGVSGCVRSAIESDYQSGVTKRWRIAA